MSREYLSYPVRIKVISQKGHCGMGHNVGDEWIYKWEPGKVDNPNICEIAFHTIFPHIRVLWFGGIFPWPTPDEDTVMVACPDAANPVVFELKRLRNKAIKHNYSEDLNLHRG